MSRISLGWFAAMLVGAFAVATLPASANLDSVVGPRVTVPNKSLSDCSSRAKAALAGTMQPAQEAGSGSGVWFGRSTTTTGGDATAAAVIECRATGTSGYVASFTCAVQVPPNPDTATTLCNKLTSAFGGSTAAIGGTTWH